ncbi:hypothetical protein DESC_930023 [Desulfosarcina cetonica]|nr:hypothetical protein DESC_930023 [Desulfosarcina cetonica]
MPCFFRQIHRFYLSKLELLTWSDPTTTAFHVNNYLNLFKKLPNGSFGNFGNR